MCLGMVRQSTYLFGLIYATKLPETSLLGTGVFEIIGKWRTYHFLQTDIFWLMSQL